MAESDILILYEWHHEWGGLNKLQGQGYCPMVKDRKMNQEVLDQLRLRIRGFKFHCIQILNLGWYVVGYMVKIHVLWLSRCVDIPPQIQKLNIAIGYPHSNVLFNYKDQKCIVFHKTSDI